jgi:hypothetical protein
MQSTTSVEHGAMRMRGTDVQQGGLFSYVSLEERVPADHPLRAIRGLLLRVVFATSPEALV